MLFVFQVVETKFFHLHDGRHLPKPWTTSVRRVGCWYKTYFIVCWRSGLHGKNQEVAGVFGEGTLLTEFVNDFRHYKSDTVRWLNICSFASSWVCLSTMKVKSIVKPGCSQDVLKAAVSAMASVTEMLTIMSSLSFSGQATIWRPSWRCHMLLRCHVPNIFVFFWERNIQFFVLILVSSTYVKLQYDRTLAK